MAELREYMVAQLVKIQGAIVAVDDLPAGRDEDGVRQRAGPFLVEGGGEVIRATGVEVIVRAAAFALERTLEAARSRRVAILEELQRAGLLLQVVHADRD